MAVKKLTTVTTDETEARPDLEDELSRVKKRNRTVEVDKAWETSWTRRILIALGTYVIIGGYLMLLDVERAWLHALVPPIAYILSTLSLPLFKVAWINRCYKNGRHK